MLVLWTDALVYILVVGSALCAWHLSRQLHMRRPLKKIASNSVAMASLTILLCFVLIGLADSIHFKDVNSKANEAISLLDMGIKVLRTSTEKTYSAPFSAYLYNKETITNADNSTNWDYPRLVHGGRHLQNPDTDKSADIISKTLIAIVPSTALMVLIYFVTRRVYLHRHLSFLDTSSGKAVLISLCILIVAAHTLLYLSRYYHVFGTDKIGEDVFYQTLKSIRTGLVIGTLTTLVMLPFAIVLGIMAGYFKGWIDDIIQFIYTTLNSVPSVLLIAASILMVQVYMSNHAENFTNLLVRADMRLLFLCLILGVTNWTGLCRLLRAETLKLREMEYVLAARAMGVKPATILFRHIFPNVMHIVLISVVLDFSSLVLAEAVLSYIHIGVDPTTHSWGNMINSARLELAREPIVWWSLVAAFVFMFTLVLAANLFADSVRDAFDPKRAS
jgi:peptide/nickel transport system permease protein